MSTPLVDVCLLTWNGEALLPTCLRSLDAQTFRDWRAYLGDNGSSDGTVALLRAWAGERATEVAEAAQNVGFAAGFNALIAQGKAPYVFVLNQDAELEPNYLAALVDAMEHDQRLGSVSGLLLRQERRTDGELMHTELVDAAGLKMFRTHRFVELHRGEMRSSLSTIDAEVFGASAVAVLFRRQALDAVAIQRDGRIEYFDESFFSYKEDIDLAYRLRLLGWKSTTLVEAQAYHVRGLRGDAVTHRLGSLNDLRLRRRKKSWQNYVSYRNHLMMLFGDCFFPAWTAAWWWTMFYEIAKLLVLLMTEPRTLAAWREVWQNRRSIWTKRRQLLQAGADWRRVAPWIS